MTNEQLVDELVRAGVLRTPRLEAAFRAIDRGLFVLKEHQARAYEDKPLPIGFGQTISQPLTVALMLEWLAPEAGQRILEIGSGSGWQTALLAHAIGPRGRIIAIERLPEMVSMTIENVERFEYGSSGRVRVLNGDGSKGAPLELVPSAGFDRIICAASADRLPVAWREQLAIGGRLVAPVGESVVIIDRLAKKKFRTTERFGFAFVPLIEDTE